MTAREMAADIGRTGLVRVESFRIPVTVLDVRVVFNRTDYLVAPSDPHAQGEAWVAADRVHLYEELVLG